MVLPKPHWGRELLKLILSFGGFLLACQFCSDLCNLFYALISLFCLSVWKLDSTPQLGFPKSVWSWETLSLMPCWNLLCLRSLSHLPLFHWAEGRHQASRKTLTLHSVRGQVLSTVAAKRPLSARQASQGKYILKSADRNDLHANNSHYTFMLTSQHFHGTQCTVTQHKVLYRLCASRQFWSQWQTNLLCPFWDTV